MLCGCHLLCFIIFSFPDVLNRDRTFCLFSPLGKTWRILFHPPLRAVSNPLNVLLNFCCRYNSTQCVLVGNVFCFRLHFSVNQIKLFIEYRGNVAVEIFLNWMFLGNTYLPVPSFWLICLEDINYKCIYELVVQVVLFQLYNLSNSTFKRHEEF